MQDSLPGPAFWGEGSDGEGPGEDLTLKLLRVAGRESDEPGNFSLQLETTRGPIEGILCPVEGGSDAVICVGGAMGGLDGPAAGLYQDRGVLLTGAGISVLRLAYRMPNNFEESVLDVLAGCSFLKGIGASGAVLVGHSFGGAVVIKAGQLSPMVRAVASLSPQLFGTRQVEELGRPLLLVHGMSDSVLSHEASEDIYRRALEPKRLVLYAGAGHLLIQAQDDLRKLLAEWIPAQFRGSPPEAHAAPAPGS